MREFEPAGPVLARFHRSPALVRAVLGPMQAGKRTSCVNEILLKAADQTRAMPRTSEQPPSRMRWVVVSATKEELVEETIPSWHRIVAAPSAPGAEDGKGIWDPRTLRHEFKPWRGLVVEILFLGLNQTSDRQRFLSVKATGVYLDRARDIAEGDFERAIKIAAGYREPTTKRRAPWQGVILASRMPNDDHWLKRRFVDEASEGHALFRLPDALSQGAVNPGGFDYRAEMKGLTPDLIRTEITAEWGNRSGHLSLASRIERSYEVEAA